MKFSNLVAALVERERNPKRSLSKILDGVLEYKTSSLSTLHLNYDLKEATRSTYVIAFSPDRTKIATSHGNHTVKISDCFSCNLVCTLKGHLRTPWCVTFHPKINTLLASGCLGGQVRLWDLNKIAADSIVYESQSVISSLTFHPVDDVLVISTQNKIIFYDWNVRKVLKTLQMKSHMDTVRLVRFLPDGSKLITAIANTASQYWKPERLDLASRSDTQPCLLRKTVSCTRLNPPERKNLNSSPRRSNESDDELNSSPNIDTREERLHSNYDEDIPDKLKSEMYLEHLENRNLAGRFKKSNRHSIRSEKVSSTSTNFENDSPRKKTKYNLAKKDGTYLKQKRCIDFQQQEESSEISEPVVPSGDSESAMVNYADIGTTMTPSTEIKSPLITSTTGRVAGESYEDKGSIVEVSRDKKPLMRSVNRTFGETTASTAAVTTTAYKNSSTTSPSCSLSGKIAPKSDELQSKAHNNNDSLDSATVTSTSGLYPSAQCSSDRQGRNPRRTITGYRRHGNYARQRKTEIWNFTLGDTVSTEQISTPENLNDLNISVEGAASTIPVNGCLTFPFHNVDQSTGITNLSGVQTAVATATARSSHHVHTAVVIGCQEDEHSQVTLQTAVNRAIAGAFAGSGEAAVANNIIDTTHRLQLWDSNDLHYPDINNVHKNVIVPLCKVHNDSSMDVSQDGSCIAVFIPNEHGFPMDAQIQVISLRTETFLHCLYSRKFGPNAVSVSISPLNNFLMVGLASRELHWHVNCTQLVGQILQLPSGSKVSYEDKRKPLLNILHYCDQSQRSKVSVNTLQFHPSPGMGILYGTNRGHVQHCHIAPDMRLQEKRLCKVPGTVKR